MIAVDTSALIAVLLGEQAASACSRALSGERKLVISAVTLAEALIVARTNGVEAELIDLIGSLPFEIAAIEADGAWRINEIYRQWGKRYHPAQLNICDCFSYDVAKQFGCPLLYIGNDFSQTDIISALA